MSEDADSRRHVGVFGATLVGIGGIIGGGLLILVGTAFGQAGPAAILAFGLNGIVAWAKSLGCARSWLGQRSSSASNSRNARGVSVRIA